ncbi:MAG TPA: SHOCT domain-containing protein [Burkholderiaceae bacterium]|nr:SHOCT domain-containing protein [Burkholderiaceae bacterium]
MNLKMMMAVVATVGLGAACGSDPVTVQGTTTISKGQELSDLQAALQAGAIDEKEYESLRQRILKRPN